MFDGFEIMLLMTFRDGDRIVKFWHNVNNDIRVLSRSR